MGRTNKLVDGCYSYWQGALLPLLHQLGPQLLQQMGLSASMPEVTPELAAELAKEPIVVPSFPSRKPASPLQQAQDAIDRCQVSLSGSAVRHSRNLPKLSSHFLSVKSREDNSMKTSV